MLLNKNFCPECEFIEKKVALCINKGDLWECPECNLQLAIYGAAMGVIFRERGIGDFIAPKRYCPSEDEVHLIGVGENKYEYNEKKPFSTKDDLNNYLKDKVEPYFEFTILNLIDSFVKYKYGEVTKEKLSYKRLSKHFNIDFEDDRILKTLESRTKRENLRFARHYKHLHTFLLHLFSHYHRVNVDRLPEMGMSQNQLEFFKKHIPDIERAALMRDNEKLKVRLFELIYDLVSVIYFNQKPLTNPWYEFRFNKTEDDYIIAEERTIIDEFNKKNKVDYQIHKEIMPSPFMGNVEIAPIVLLTLNPCFGEKEQEKGFYKKYSSWFEENLTHVMQSSKYSLFSLDEAYKEYSPYWYNKLRPLHLDNEATIHNLSSKLCKIQFFPYTTKKFKNIPSKYFKDGEKYLTSQHYNFHLVKKAMKRDAIIILTRAKKYWFEAIPELEKYPNLYFTKNYRNPVISEKNCPEGYRKIKEVLT